MSKKTDPVGGKRQLCTVSCSVSLVQQHFASDKEIVRNWISAEKSTLAPPHAQLTSHLLSAQCLELASADSAPKETTMNIDNISKNQNRKIVLEIDFNKKVTTRGHTENCADSVHFTNS